jgi:hypothetical protein
MKQSDDPVLVDRDIFEACLEKLIRERGIANHFQTAFDAADISLLMDEAVIRTEQAMLRSCSKYSGEAP